MSVTTRLYASYDEARSAADAIAGLNLAEVDASVLGDDRLERSHSDWESRFSVDQRAIDPDEASGAATGAGLGAALGGTAGLLAGFGLMAIPGLGPVVAAGWLAATAVGAIGGAATGGAIGALSDLDLSEEDAPLYAEAVRRGGVLVSVRFPDEYRYRVEGALDRFAATEIDDLRSRYEEEGWREGETEEERRERTVL